MEHSQAGAKMMIILLAAIFVFSLGKGKMMASFKLEMKYAAISCIIFPREYEKSHENLNPNTVICITGDWNKDSRSDSAMQMIVTAVKTADFILKAERSPEAVCPAARGLNPIRVKIRSKCEQQQVLAFIKENTGSTPVVLIANGKEYPIKAGVQLNMKVKEFFSNYQF